LVRFGSSWILPRVWGFGGLGLSSKASSWVHPWMPATTFQLLVKTVAFYHSPLRSVDLVPPLSTCARLFQVLQDLVAEIQLRDLSFFSSQGLTNIAWAYAHWLQGPNNMVLGLFGNIDVEVTSRGLSSMRVAELSVIAWAFAKTGYKDGSMLGLLHDSICSAGSLDAYNEQNLVMCLWALSCTEHSSKGFLDMVEDEILDRGLEAFKAREINAAVFALSKAKHASQRLWDAIDEEAGERARSVDRFEVGETLRDYSLDAQHVDDHHEAGADPTESSFDEVHDDQGGERRGRDRNRRQ